MKLPSVLHVGESYFAEVVHPIQVANCIFPLFLWLLVYINFISPLVNSNNKILKNEKNINISSQADIFIMKRKGSKGFGKKVNRIRVVVHR